MIDKNKLTQIVEATIEQQGEVFLVQLNVSSGNDIEVILDSDTYVCIDQCITLSKSIEGQLDREVEDFSLSVFSAGIGQPLIKERQFRKCVGKPVEVIMKSGGKFTGELVDYMGDAISLKYQLKEVVEGKKRKEMVEHIDNIDMANIKSVSEELTIK